MATPNQIAAVLQTAIGLRFDVKKCVVEVQHGRPERLFVTVESYTDGQTRRREASLSKIEPDATCGEIIRGWLGNEPSQQQAHLKRNDRLDRERALYFNNTIDQVIEAKRQNRQSPTEPAPPRSKFDWKKEAKPDEVPEKTLPDNIPEATSEANQNPDVHPEAVDYNKKYIDGGELKDKLTRQQMIDQGMSREERHAQYKKQGGPHPDDPHK